MRKWIGFVLNDFRREFENGGTAVVAPPGWGPHCSSQSELFCTLTTGPIILAPVSDVTRILSAIEKGDSHAADQLLPLVYDELRKLAVQRLAQERPGHSLEPTALVHDVYIRLVDGERNRTWDSRGHFFAAAAEAMRRILVERARRHASQKRGGEWERVPLPDVPRDSDGNSVDLLSLDDALTELEKKHPQKAQIVKLRFFAGKSLEETAQLLGISRATTQRHWLFARAWLFGRMNRG
jgi:RNA polymerase sigma factor (TIGR02999 family)